MALPGWTLPGLFSLGAAQVALKQHGAFIGSRVILAGSSPPLCLAAAQYLRMGHNDLTIVDTSSAHDKRRATRGLLTNAHSTLYERLELLRELRAPRVRRIEGPSFCARPARAVLKPWTFAMQMAQSRL